MSSIIAPISDVIVPGFAFLIAESTASFAVFLRSLWLGSRQIVVAVSAIQPSIITARSAFTISVSDILRGSFMVAVSWAAIEFEERVTGQAETAPSSVIFCSVFSIISRIDAPGTTNLL